MKNNNGSTWSYYLTLGVISYAFLLFTFNEYFSVVFETELRFFGTDPFYHVRRIWLTVLQYPRILEFDYYLNYPNGAYILWPPGFDYLLATISRLILGPSPSLYSVGKVSAITVPFLGLLTVLITLRAAGRWYGRDAGLLAAMFVALSPVFILTSLVSRVDHHMMEPLFLSAALYMFERAYSAALKGDRAGARLKPALAGGTLALGLLFAPPVMMFPPLVFGFVILMALAGAARGRLDEALRVSSVRTFLWAFVLSVPLSMTSHFARAGSLDYEYLSLFQPLMFLTLFVATQSVFSLLAFLDKRGVSPKLAALTTLGVIVAGIPVVLLSDAAGGLDYIFRSDPVVASIQESRSIIFLGFMEWVRSSGYGLLLVPALIIFLLYRARREPSIASLLTAYWLFASSCLALLQSRFSPLLVPPFAIALSAAILDAPSLLARWKWAHGRQALLTTLLFVFTTALAFPGQRIFVGQKSMGFLSPVFDSLVWMRSNTPRTSYYSSPSRQPEYGVLSEWSYGHYITFYAERPNISNPFGLGEVHRKGMFDTSRFLVQTDENEAAELCERLGVRYLLMVEPSIYTDLGYLGLEKAPFYKPSKGMNFFANDKYFSTLGARLYYADGSAVNIESYNVESLGRFRLVYESRRDSERSVNDEFKLSASKVFELVKGARVRGLARPLAEVSATVEVVTNRGRTFQYHARTASGAGGGYELVLPYPNMGSPYETGAKGAYIIRSGGKSASAVFTEEEIAEGTVRELNF